MADNQVVFDIAPGQFEQQVVAASSRRPIVVDFWAEWCVPCRTLGPILERIVRSYQGRALLAKLNVDQDQQTAVRYGVHSIPAVMVFRDGRVAGEFIGALPEPEVARILAAVLPSRADELVSEGDRLLEQGRIEEAESRYRQALEQDADHAGALLRLGTDALEDGRSEEARKLLSRIEENAPEHDDAQGLLARIEFVEGCTATGGLAACERRLAQNAHDLDARYDLACCLAAEENYDRALEEFLKIVETDKNYRDQAARNAMVRIFSLIGPRTELADSYRRKLARVLY